MTDSAFVIAIDGPAASGKGTLARKIAQHYGFPHLDTGLTYRAVAKSLLDQGLPLDDERVAAKVAAEINLASLDRTVLAVHEVGEAASRVAVMPSVRRNLVEAQRQFAAIKPGSVLDGRDIGTVVCPHAAVKLYVTASPEVRAQRRFAEIRNSGAQSISEDDFKTVLSDLKQRDERDMGREDSPLRPAHDAHLLDTTKMDIETAFLTAKQLIDSAMAK